MSQHFSLSPERWAGFSLDPQILMIGNEMNRAKRLDRDAGPARPLPRLRAGPAFLDLTVEVQRRSTLRRGDLIADLYIRPEPGALDHAAAFRSLLQLTPVAAQQIPFVLG